MLKNNNLLKYIIFALLIGMILKYQPKFRIEDNAIIKIVMASIILMFILDNFIFGRIEGMNGGCMDTKIPYPYLLNHIEEDSANTGLIHDNDNPKYPLLHKGEFEKGMIPFKQVKQELASQSYGATPEKPGYYLANNGEFSEGITLDNIDKAVCASKLRDYYKQHGGLAKWAPHTHLGKGRGYINFTRLY